MIANPLMEGGRSPVDDNKFTVETSSIFIMFLQEDLNGGMLIMHSFYIYTLALFCFNQKTDC